MAGIGNISNLYTNLGPMTGLLKSTNDGGTWTQLGNAPLAAGGLQGEVVSAVLPRGNTILVGVRATSPSSDGFTPAVPAQPAVTSPKPGLFRSIDGGQSFQLISGLNNLGNGQVLDVAGDPSNANRAYVVVGGATGGVFRTDDLGAHWTNVTNLAAITTQLTSSTFTNARLAVSAAAPNPVYLAIADSGQLSGVFWSSNLGVMWTAMDLPQTADTDIDSFSVLQPAPQGINPGGQASSDLTIAADPSNPNLVYIAGDSQPDDGAGSAPFPANSVGATNYSARIFRGNTSIAPTGAVPSPQWTPLTNNGTSNNSSPHADSRAMVIDSGELLYSGDGGIFEENSPTTTTGQWLSVNGAPNGANSGIQVAQFFGISYDSLSDIILGGAQDVGTPQQSASGSQVYDDQTQGDGPSTAVDDLTSTTQSARYIGGTRYFYNSADSNIGINIPVVPSPTGLYGPPGGLNGFNNFTSVAVSTVAPPAGQSALVVINNGTNPAMPGVSGIFDSTNAGIALTTGAIVYTQIPTGAGWVGVNEFVRDRYPAIAIAGMLNGVANQDVLYAGSGSQVFLRSAATGPGRDPDRHGGAAGGRREHTEHRGRSRQLEDRIRHRR